MNGILVNLILYRMYVGCIDSMNQHIGVTSIATCQHNIFLLLDRRTILTISIRFVIHTCDIEYMCIIAR